MLIRRIIVAVAIGAVLGVVWTLLRPSRVEAGPRERAGAVRAPRATGGAREPLTEI